MKKNRIFRNREKHVMNSIIVFIRLKKDHGTTLLETSPPKLMNKFIKLLKSVILMLLSFPEFTHGNVWLNLVIPKKEADGSVLNQLENYYSNISHDYPLIWLMTSSCNETTGYRILKCEKSNLSLTDRNMQDPGVWDFIITATFILWYGWRVDLNRVVQYRLYLDVLIFLF